ncbi:MAG: hypothetical protein ACJ748_05635 [Flavisolibacter sp.]
MKNLLFILLLIGSLSSTSQTVSGLYSGKLVNDSTKKMQSYELALSEYRGKITGYSYTTFVLHDTFYYSVKRIKAVKKDDLLIVEDDKMIVNNFPEAPAKHVHQVNYIQLTNEDTLRQAIGSWKTNQTKIYYSVHGNVNMRRDNDSSHSSLINHLKELRIISEEDRHISDDAIVMTKTKVKENEQATQAVVKTVEKEKDEKSIKDKKTDKNQSTISNASTKPTIPTALPFEQRRNHLMQTLDIASDSLLLSFYDNGVIDGDSITVYMNGVNIISHNRLTAVASKKMIDISKLGETIEILVVADNLGTIPPNTGLVTVKDGDNVYQVNFTADLQTNASIVFRKQKK